MAKFTIIVQEVDTDAPPVYPDPLIYSVEMNRAPEGLWDSDWKDEALGKAEAARADESGFHSTLEFVFAFSGDLSPVADGRT